VIAEPAFYLAAVPAVILVGLAKGGFAGLVIIAMSLLAYVVNPVRAAAIMLPILIVQDFVTMWAYRKDVDRAALAVLLPGAAAGIALGALAAAHVSEAAVRLLIGSVAIVFAANHFLGFAARLAQSPAMTGRKAGFFWGSVSGFTSHVSHAGGPPYQVWMLSRKLARDPMVATTAWYFGIVNLIKLPFFIGLGQLDGEAMTTALALMPVAVAATLAGIWLVRRTPMQRFYQLIHALMLLAGLKLAYEGLTALGRSVP
jgi:uncharacterized membrane protein YfcA